MKSAGFILSNFILIAAGVILCVLNTRPDFLRTIVMIVGGAFVLAGLINVGAQLRHAHKKEGNSFSRFAGWFSGVGGVLLGCAMFFGPNLFVSIIAYVFAVLLILGGLTQIVLFAWAFRPYNFPGWLYVLPVLIIIDGVVIFFADAVRTNDATMTLLTGIGLILFGLGSFLAIACGKNSELKKEIENHEVKEIEDVEHVHEETHKLPSPEPPANSTEPEENQSPKQLPGKVE